ncbi:hypothetical protein HOLleu_42106 [Holothuria leucospilota]|uniref:Uncharacterized protein n=1 Tax=Holothuria leucospilota TaxID=206669 RepID=A0A9Q0YBW6_HOLLE|nr:hypothetical protein HOLleu_42106 [Holothuria leucospilota]
MDNFMGELTEMARSGFQQCIYVPSCISPVNTFKRKTYCTHKALTFVYSIHVVKMRWTQTANLLSFLVHLRRVLQRSIPANIFYNKAVHQEGSLKWHLLAVHKDEPDVAAIIALDDQAERKKRLDLLRNKGNFLHNQQVLDAGAGQIILMRRPQAFHDLDYQDYGPCPQCLGYVLLKDIWRHTHYRCIARNDGKSQRGSGKGELQMQSQILANNKMMGSASEGLKKHVLAKMQNNNISRTAKSDDAILELGNVWLKKVGGQRKAVVSSKMLSSSRMVDELRKLCPNEGEYVSDFLKPKCFDAILQAANNLGGPDMTETGDSSYEKPSTVLKLGHDMKRLATIKFCRALRSGDQTAEKEAKDYLFLHEKEWGLKMSCTALTTLKERKFNKGQNLPQTSDLVKLTQHVLDQLKLAMEDIMNDVSSQHYKRLQKLCLVRLLLFNKRRPGELSQLTVQAYKERPNWAEGGIQEMRESFTTLEQKLLTAMDLVYIRGKGEIMSLLSYQQIVRMLSNNWLHCGTRYKY